MCVYTFVYFWRVFKFGMWFLCAFVCVFCVNVWCLCTLCVCVLFI